MMSFLLAGQWSGVIQRDENKLTFVVFNADTYHPDILEWVKDCGYELTHETENVESVWEDIISFGNEENAQEFKAKFYTDGKINVV